MAAIHTNDNYGTRGISRIIELGKEKDICVNVIASLDTDQDFTNQTVRTQLKNNIIQLQAKAANKEIVIIYFGVKDVIASFFNNPIYMYEISELKRVKWLMSDFVGTSTAVFRDAIMDYTAGIFTLSTSSIHVQDVQTFYDDKWRTRNTQYQNDPLKKLMVEVGSDSKDEWRNDYVMAVIDSVYAMADAVRQAFIAKCRRYTTVCDGFDTHLKSNILDYLRNVNFSYVSLNETVGPSELIDSHRSVSFDVNGDLQSDGVTPLYDVNIYNGSSFLKV